MKYGYQVIHDSVVISSGLLTLPQAKRVLRERLNVRTKYEGGFEIERVLVLADNARQYWRWRDGKWRMYPTHNTIGTATPDVTEHWCRGW